MKSEAVVRRCFVKKDFFKNFTNLTCKQLRPRLFLKSCRLEGCKNRLQHSCFPVNFAKFLRAPMLQNICEGIQIFSQENTGDGVLFSATVGMRASSLIKKYTPSQILYYEISEILQNIIFAEHCWTTLSNFHQQVGRIACLISNVSIQNHQCINSGTASCLGFPETAICKKSKVFVLEIFKVYQKKAA